MSEANNVRVQKMDSNELGRYVADQTVGVLRHLEELRPLYTELWERFDNLKQDEKILGCRTKTEYCQKILHRSIRSVQYALNGRATRTEPDRPFSKLRPVDVEYVEDFVPDYIAKADRERERKQRRENNLKSDADEKRPSVGPGKKRIPKKLKSKSNGRNNAERNLKSAGNGGKKNGMIVKPKKSSLSDS